MDAATFITTALAAGASALYSGALKGLTSAASDAIKDAYHGARDFIKKKYSKVGVDSLESEPSSRRGQAIVKEDLERTQADSDGELLILAQKLLKVVNEYSSSTIKAVSGVTFDEIEAGGDILLENIRAGRGSGVSVEHVKAGRNVTVRGIEAGVPIAPELAVRDTPDASGEQGDSTTLDRVSAGRDLNVNNVKVILALRTEPHKTWLADPRQPWDILTQPTVSLSELREALRTLGRLETPILITVKGTFFPAALLSSGWWEQHAKAKVCEPLWRTPLQQWLFHGFQEWGPSWDFCWDFAGSQEAQASRFFIGQIADGDEANSIPVLLPYEKARRLYDECRCNWGGVEAAIRGLLGHRSHFPVEVVAAGLLGDSLDYCIKVMPDDRSHRIELLTNRTELYSGYLWTCVAPKAWIKTLTAISLDQVFFLWEHTDFTKEEARRYNLESLSHKEAQIRRQFGEVILLQKSSSLIEGEPLWSGQEFHDHLVGKAGKII